MFIGTLRTPWRIIGRNVIDQTCVTNGAKQLTKTCYNTAANRQASAELT